MGPAAPPTCRLPRPTPAPGQSAPPPGAHLDVLAPPSLGLVSASATIGLFLCQSSSRDPPPLRPPRPSARPLDTSAVKLTWSSPSPAGRCHKGSRGDAPPTRPARPLAGLTSGLSGPPLVSLLPRRVEAGGAVFALLSMVLEDRGRFRAHRGVDLGNPESLKPRGPVTRPGGALPVFPDPGRGLVRRSNESGGGEGKKREKREARYRGRPPRPSGWLGLNLSPLTLTHALQAIPHLRAEQRLPATAVASPRLTVQWDRQTCPHPTTGAAESGQGRHRRVQRTWRPRWGEHLTQPGCQNPEGRDIRDLGPGG